MARLEDIEWQDGQGLEALLSWGIAPAFHLADAMIELLHTSPKMDKDKVEAFAYALLYNAQSVGRCLCRFVDTRYESDPGDTAELLSEFKQGYKRYGPSNEETVRAMKTALYGLADRLERGEWGGQ